MNKRMEYIDAMRGFAILIVLIIHIFHYGYGLTYTNMESMPTFNIIFGRFYMPLFFFISGFVCSNRLQMNISAEVKDLVLKKFSTLLVSPLVFLSLYVLLTHRDFAASICDDMKAGYWFTFTLFTFLLIYKISATILSKWEAGINNDIILCLIAIILYCIGSIYRYFQLQYAPIPILSILGCIHLRYYVFFCLGRIIRRRLGNFLNLMDSKYSMAICIVTITIFFIMSRIFPIHNYNTLTFIPQGILYIFIIFTFFNKHKDGFVTHTKGGKWLQYIGRHTLEIYFLHFFFLPKNLNTLGEWLFQNPNPAIELAISLVLALPVIFTSLIVSNIINLSPLLAKFLFGAKITTLPQKH